MNPLYYLILEWRKFASNWTIRFLVGSYAVLVPLASFLLFLVLTIFGEKIFQGASRQFFAEHIGFPYSWGMVSYLGSWGNVFFVGLFGVFAITLDMSYKTLRQNVISGMSRDEIFFSKIILLAGVSAAATLCLLVTGLLTGVVYSQSSYTTLEMFPPLFMIIAYFLQAFGYAVLGMLIGFIIRQTALATLVYLTYVLVFEFLLRWALYWALRKNEIVFNVPDKLLEELVTLPTISQESVTLAVPEIEIWVGALAYIGLFMGWFYWRIKQSDL